MVTKVIALAVAASLHIGVGERVLSVSQGSHQLVKMWDPAADTCWHQEAYVRSRHDQRIVAMWAKCFHGVENYSRTPLKVRVEMRDGSK